VLPAHLAAGIDPASWSTPPIFGLIADRGRVPAQEMERTFNMGVGMVAVVPPDRADAALALLADRGVPAWVAGTIHPR
jgi:phosphoribosylformylglycinamidine cyclo-ligase